MNNWQDISTAPKDGSHVLLYRPEIQFIGYYAEAGWCTVSDGGSKILRAPTHWRHKYPDPRDWETIDWQQVSDNIVDMIKSIGSITGREVEDIKTIHTTFHHQRVSSDWFYERMETVDIDETLPAIKLLSDLALRVPDLVHIAAYCKDRAFLSRAAGGDRPTTLAEMREDYDGSNA